MSEKTKEIIFVIAPTHQIAYLWTYNNRIHLRNWTYLDDADRAMGVKSAKIVLIKGDRDSSFFYSEHQLDMIERAKAFAHSYGHSFEEVIL